MVTTNPWLSALAGVCATALIVATSAVIARRLAGWVLSSPTTWLETAAITGLVGIVDIVVTLQVLGLLGIAWLPVVLVTQIAVCAMCLWRLPAPQPTVPASPNSGAERRMLHLVVAGAIIAGSLAAILALSGPSPAIDTNLYHIPNAADVLQTGNLWHLPFSNPGDIGMSATATEPGDGELLTLAGMLPFHSTLGAQLPNVLVLIILGLCLAQLMVRLGASLSRASLGALAIVIAPLLYVDLVHTAYTDGVALLGLVAGVMCSLSAVTSDRPRGRMMVLAGTALGLALGSKFAFIPVAVPIGLTMAVILRRHLGSALLAGAAGAAGLAGLWYGRNWILAGNPVFPLPVIVLGHQIFPGLTESGTAIPGTNASILSGLRGELSGRLVDGLAYTAFWAGTLAALTLTGVGTGLTAARRATGGPVRGILLVLAGCAIAYLVTPQTGSSVTAVLNASVRFATPLYVTGVVLFVVTAPSSWADKVLQAAAGVGITIDVVHFLPTDAPAVGIGIGLGVIVTTVWLRRFRRPGRRATAGVALLALLTATILAVILAPARTPGAASNALDNAAASGAPVVVVGVLDVASVIGPNLDVHLIAPDRDTQGRINPVHNQDEMRDLVDASAASVLAAGPTFNPSPRWHRIGSQGDVVVFLREA